MHVLHLRALTYRWKASNTAGSDLGLKQARDMSSSPIVSASCSALLELGRVRSKETSGETSTLNIAA